jgi:hypothetical protein
MKALKAVFVPIVLAAAAFAAEGAPATTAPAPAQTLAADQQRPGIG